MTRLLLGAAIAALVLSPLNAFGRQTLTPGQAYPLVQRSDVLRIQNTFSSWIRSVEADGTISFPTLGTLKVEGMTSRQVEALIERGLTEKGLLGTRDHIIVEVSPAQAAAPAPQVSKPQVIFINGEVRTPGSTTIAKPSEMTLMHALAAAGSVTPMAGPDIYILRSSRPRAGGEPTPLSLDNTSAQKFKYNRKQLMDRFEDPPIQAGDTIWVEAAQMYIINGEVKSGGLKVWEPGVTVGDAIAMASGLTDKGRLGRSYIQRKNDKGTFDKIGNLKLETPLQPKDQLVIVR